MRLVKFIITTIIILAVLYGIYWYFKIYKPKKNTATTTDGKPLSKVGTVVHTAFGDVIVAITPLTQKLLDGISFANNPKILSGEVPVKFKRTNLNNIPVGQYFTFDRTLPKLTGVWQTYHTYQDYLVTDNVLSGIPWANILWHKAPDNSRVNQYIAHVSPYSSSTIIYTDTTLGVFNNASTYTVADCIGDYYYTLPGELTFPTTTVILDFFKNDISQWLVVDVAATQTALNLAE